MSNGSPAAAAVSSAAQEAVTRPISAVNQTGRRSHRRPRHALAWAVKLTLLAAYVTGVYLVVAVGFGALAPWSPAWQSALRLAAVAITAAGFTPVRHRVGAMVDRRLLPGASRYEVLTSLAARLQATGPLEEALPGLARILGEATEARQAAVWLRSGPGFARATVWPLSRAPLGSPPLTRPAELGRRDDIDVFAAVRDGGEMLGALSVALPPGRSPGSPDIRLVTDLANSAGFLLRNTLLTAELSQRLRTVSEQATELGKSRRRLVVARDIARRRLAHELAVSVQGSLDAIGRVVVALRGKVHDAAGDKEALQKATSQARAVIGAGRAETDALIARFRSVVHGIYPPALSDHGLATAVESLAATLPRATRISVHGGRRYRMELESALYFCAAAALRVLAARGRAGTAQQGAPGGRPPGTAQRGAGGPATARAAPLRIRLADTGRHLVLTIIDESRSDELGDEEHTLLDEMSDHAGALGGTVTATAIDGRLWLQAAIPLSTPPANGQVPQAGPDSAAEIGDDEPGPGEITEDPEAMAGDQASEGSPAGGPARARGGRRSRGDVAFWIGFALYSGFAAAWLLLGLAVGVVANVPPVREATVRLAHSGHPPWLADVAAGLVAGLPKSYPAGEVLFDYLFSAMSIAIAVALLWLARRDWTVRLLAVGMVGSAGAFNLQAHASMAAVARMTGLSIGWWHSLLLHGVGGVAYLFALLLFPTGRLRGDGRSRWAGGALAFAGLAGAAALLSESTAQYPHTVSFVVFFGLLTPVAGITAQWRRYVHAADPGTRQQSAVLLRALVLAFGAAVLLSAGGLVIGAAHLPGFTADPTALVFWIFRGVFAVIPCALLVGVLRFRLWDVEKLFNRALVYGLLALLIGLLYVVLVVGAGLLLGLPMRSSPVLQIAATAAVAGALAPARGMLSRFASRLAYGRRPAPYHVLAKLSALSQATLSGVATLPSLARIIGDGLGARSCEVRLIRPDGQQETRSWRAGTERAVERGGEPAARAGAAVTSVPVVHRGITVGEIRIEPPAGGLAPAQRQLLTHLADGAGLVLHNARLAFELERRLAVISEQAAAIAASRRRITAAQAAERQALERNLHDGAQPHLIAIRISLGLAQHRISAGEAGPDADGDGGAGLAAALDGIAARITNASASLAEIATGLYPPKLTEEGIAAALRAHVAAMPGDTVLHFANGTEQARFDADVEAAVCFACLEAMQNARKHAPDAAIGVTLARDAGGLTFTVADNGPGAGPEAVSGFGLQSMADRIAAVGGTVEFRSQPGAGTTVLAWVPAGGHQPAGETAASAASS